jgi:hypothetical protein
MKDINNQEPLGSGICSDCWALQDGQRHNQAVCLPPACAASRIMVHGLALRRRRSSRSGSFPGAWLVPLASIRVWIRSGRLLRAASDSYAAYPWLQKLNGRDYGGSRSSSSPV